MERKEDREMLRRGYAEIIPRARNAESWQNIAALSSFAGSYRLAKSPIR
jgi:hypothetical protein